MSFDSLGLGEPLLRAVSDAGYRTPTPIQAQAIPHVLAGSDLLACAQTGTGKTAAFALPLIERLSTSAASASAKQRRRIRVLVLAPTRELATQIADNFRDYGRHSGLRHTVIYGGVSQGPQTRALHHGVDVVIATPGRLLDLIGQGFVKLDAVQALVLDEADRMLDMGFLPDVRKIIALLPAKRQTLLFSATLPPAIEQLAERSMHEPVRVRVASTETSALKIEQSVFHVPMADKKRLLGRYLSGAEVKRALVFTRTKHGADRLTKHLSQMGVAAEAMHGNKSQNARQRSLEAFRGTRIRVLVATDVAARGIDVDGITHIVNFDLPVEPETYVHRIGRTARAGAAGIAVTFCDRSERKQLVAIERLIRQEIRVEQDAEFPPETRPLRAATRSHGKPASGAPREARGAAGSGERYPKKSFRPPWADAGKAKEVKKRRTAAALGK